jgi:hypothetical protein
VGYDYFSFELTCVLRGGEFKGGGVLKGEGGAYYCNNEGSQEGRVKLEE